MNATTLPRNTRIPRTLPRNGFDDHGIAHLSPSSLNTWIACPSFWIMERLIGRKGSVGCSAHRGTAAELGVSHALFNPAASVSDCAALALERYDELAAGSSDPERDKQRGCIAGMVVQGALALRPLGVPDKPDAHQHKIEIFLDDVPVPLIGYLDWRWNDQGVIVDMKSTLRVPSSMSDPHRRQASAYQHANSNHAVRFTYVSDKKAETHVLSREDYTVGIRELRHAAIRLGRFLALSKDPYELASVVTPDFSSFYWSDPEARALGARTYGF